eukprot:130219_1
MLEWWYFNTHLVSKKNGERFSLFASYFRQAEGVPTEENPSFFYDACTWALIDVEKEHYHADNLLDHRATDNLVKRLDPKITGRPCVHAEGALLELAQKGRLPRPDRRMKAAANVKTDKLSLNYDDECTLEKIAAAHSQPATAPKCSYKVKTHNPAKDIRAELTFTPQMQPVRHGDCGVVNEMFYYYIPRCIVS